MNLGVLVEAIYLGAVYAVVAFGFTIIFAPTRVVNFAQGEFLILGAAGAYQLQAAWGWNPVAVIGVVMVGAVALGALTERMIMLPVRLSRSRFAWIIATLATAIILQSLFGLAYPSALLRPPPMVSAGWNVLGVDFSAQEVLIVLGALAIIGAYDQFLKRTIYGRAIRAAAHDADSAQLMGIGVRAVVLVSFSLSAIATALVGMLAAPTLFIAPTQGLLFTIKGFVAIVVGGVGSARGALFGGMTVALLDAVVRNMVSATVGNMVVVAALALILLAFPSGLFGKPMAH